MSDAAADEFAQMTLEKNPPAHHPEDRDYHYTDKEFDDHDPDRHTDTVHDHYNSDDGEDSKYSSNMTKTRSRGRTAPSIQPASNSTDIIPTKSFGTANTGPKGVIADARSFEEARRRELAAKQGPAYSTTVDFVPAPVSSSTRLVPSEDDRMRSASSDDDEDEMMLQWRKNRLQELKNGASGGRRKSPSRRKFGRLESVDANGYLDAVEKVAGEVVVVVTIYDDKSSESQFVEDCMGTLARRHVCTRFIKLHYTEAEMDRKVVPAVLAYKGGELIANMPRVVDEIPTGRNLSSESLEVVLKKANVLESEKLGHATTSSRTSLYNWDDE